MRWVVALIILLVSLITLRFMPFMQEPLNKIERILSSQDDGMNQVWSRVALVKKARKLAVKGELDEALRVYEESMQPQYNAEKHHKSTAMGGVREIYKWQGDYENALKATRWFSGPVEDEIREIEALMHYRDTGSPEKIYEHIDLLKNENKDEMPPVKFGGMWPSIFSDIIRLYDTIGDLDKGLEYVEMLINFSKENSGRQGREIEVYERIKTSKEARKCYESKYTSNKDPNWATCNVLVSYYAVREAFERDKAAGTKGSATQALIQSDYFPW